MNGFVPMLVAVLLAEFGPRASVYAHAPKPLLSGSLMLAATIAAAVGGWLISPSLTGWADALMIAIALIFAAVGQVQRVLPAVGVIPVVVAFWRGGTPLLAFAFAARFGPSATITGAAAGVVLASIGSLAADTAPINTRPIRTVAATLLGAAAAYVAVAALRLI